MRSRGDAGGGCWGFVRVTAALGAAAAALALAAPASAPAANTMVVQPDGRIVLAGSSSMTPLLLRFEPDGSFDQSFGNGGVVPDSRVSGRPVALDRQPDGNLVVLTDWFELSRYRLDGGPDFSFGDAGVEEIEDAAYIQGDRGRLTPAALAFLPDGSILTAGDIHFFNMFGFFNRAFLQRTAPDGSSTKLVSLLPGSAGRPIIETFLSDVALAADGSVLGVGRYKLARPTEASPPLVGLLTPVPPGSPALDDPGVLPAGAFDDFPPESEASAIAVEGRSVLVVGSAAGQGLVARFDSSLAPDPGFGQGGVATFPVPGAGAVGPMDLVAQPDGTTVLAGLAEEPCVEPSRERRCAAVFVARLGPSGALDRTFGEGGFVRLPLQYERGERDRGVSVALSGGRILVGGQGLGRGRALFVARLLPDGRLDGSFGNGGVVTAELCEGFAAKRRREGCIAASARIQFRVSGLAAARPSFAVRAVGGTQLDPISAVHVRLPASIRAGSPRGTRVGALVNGKRIAARAHEHDVDVYGFRQARALSIRVPPGVLRMAERIRPGRKLRFGIVVQFADGRGLRFQLVRRS